MSISTLFGFYQNCECKDHPLGRIPPCNSNTEKCKNLWSNHLERFSCIVLTNKDFGSFYINEQKKSEMMYKSIFHKSYKYLTKCERYNLLYN